MIQPAKAGQFCLRVLWDKIRRTPQEDTQCRAKDADPHGGRALGLSRLTAYYRPQRGLAGLAGSRRRAASRAAGVGPAPLHGGAGDGVELPLHPRQHGRGRSGLDLGDHRRIHPRVSAAQKSSQPSGPGGEVLWRQFVAEVGAEVAGEGADRAVLHRAGLTLGERPCGEMLRASASGTAGSRALPEPREGQCGHPPPRLASASPVGC